MACHQTLALFYFSRHHTVCGSADGFADYLFIPTPQSYLWSLGIAVLLSFLNVVRELPFNWWRRIIAALLLIAVAGGVGVMARPWVPPATLWLTKVAVTDEI